MSSQTCDICVSCSKIIRECHKNIFCRICNGYVHKKCLKLKPKQLKELNTSEWTCDNCTNTTNQSSNSDVDDNLNVLKESPDFNVKNVDLKKYDEMIFNPLRFDCDTTNKGYNDVVDNEFTHKCTYLTPDQFCSVDSNAPNGNLNLLNVNIRSLSKNFDSLKECINTLNTHL